MKKHVIYLPIETSSRELQSRMLIAASIPRSNALTVIAPTGVLRSVADRVPGVYLHKRHGLGDLNLVKGLTDRGNLVVAIDEEELLGPPKPNWGEDSSNPLMLEQLSVVFTNSESHLLALQKSRPEYSRLFVMSGNPRVELTSSALTKFRRTQIPRRVPRIPFILINTNFSSGNFSRSYGMQPLEQRKRLNHGAGLDQRLGSQKLKEEGRRIAEESRLFEAYVSGIHLLSKRFPDIPMIVRPHPTEDLRRWKDQLNGIRNVNVLRTGSASAFMERAICVIHPGSTTAHEARLMGVPTIEFLPDHDRRVIGDVSTERREGNSELARNLDELTAQISRILSEPQLYRDLGPSDNHAESPSRIIAEKMAGLNPVQAGLAATWLLWPLVSFYSWKLEIALLIRQVKSTLRVARSSSLGSATMVGADHMKFPWLHYGSVRDGLRALVLGDFNFARCRKISLSMAGPRSLVFRYR